MNEQRTSRDQVPLEVGKLWAQLHAESLGNYELLRAQKGGIPARRILAIGIPLALFLVLVTLAGLYASGSVNIPTFACDLREGLCTPTPTVVPTVTPYPTFTPLPPTPTHTPAPTPTPTPTPLPYGEWLEGCEWDDFSALMVQTSSTEQTQVIRTLGEITDLKTRLTLTNTGTCLLLGSEFNIQAGTEGPGEIKPVLPERINPGQAIDLDYLWPSLSEGMYTVTLTLIPKSSSGKPLSLDNVGVLTLDLTILVDRDGDGVFDFNDDCLETPGLAVFNGCPDRDADGVMDKEDCCPDTPGTIRGCADRDNDGFPDNGGVCSDLLPDGCVDKPCGHNGGCPTCSTVFDRCPREVCEPQGKDDLGTPQPDKCHIEYDDCNPHEVCTCP